MPPHARSAQSANAATAPRGTERSSAPDKAAPRSVAGPELAASEQLGTQAAPPLSLTPGAGGDDAHLWQRSRQTPHDLRAVDVLRMQQRLGNRLTQRILRPEPQGSAPVSELTTAANPLISHGLSDAGAGLIQRKITSPGSTASNTTTATLSNTVDVPQGAAGGPSDGVSDPNSAGRLQPMLSSGSGSEAGLPSPLLSGLWRHSKLDLSDVRVHRNSDRPGQIQALAYAQDPDIYLAQGQEQLLPHEAWHVVQQRQGRVQADFQGYGLALNASPALEQEADREGAQALALGQASDVRTLPRGSGHTTRPTHAPIQRKTAEEVAKARGITLDQLGPPSHSSLVMDPDKNVGQSLAANPALEAQRELFEHRLGILAFHDPRANEGAAKLCRQIKRYLDARIKDLKSDKALEDFHSLMTSTLAGDKHFAGTVTQTNPKLKDEEARAHIKHMMETISQVIESGNLRERMNLVDQFMKLLSRDYKAANQPSKRQELIALFTSADIDTRALEARFNGSKASLLDENVTSQLTQENRDEIRVASNKGMAEKTRMVAHDLYHTPLSSRERMHQGALEMEAQKRDRSLLQEGYNRPLHFTEGGRYFLVNEQSRWAEQLRALSLPLKAGPSGHTAIFYQANRLLNAEVEPEIIRLMAIGHLLPIRAHSLIEILDTAMGYGCKLDLSKPLTQQLAPYTEQELRETLGGALPGEKDTLGRFERWKVDALHDALQPPVASLDSPAEQKALLALQKQRADELLALTKAGHVSGVLKETSAAGKHTHTLLNQHLSQVRLSPNIRAALKTAQQESVKHEEEARTIVEKRLKAMKFDLGENHALYNAIVARVVASPITINLRTNLLEAIFRGGAYLNQWERSVHPASGQKAYYGDGDYAITRNETEKTLHRLPELLPLNEAAQTITPAVVKKRQNLIGKLEASIGSVPGLTAELKPLQEANAARAEQLEVLVQSMGQHHKAGTVTSPAAKQIQAEYEKLYKLQKEEIARLERKIKELKTLTDSLGSKKLELAKLQLEQQLETGALGPARVTQSGFQEARSLPTDRPHSAAVNASFRGGAAAKSLYGTTHLVLRENVKARSTLAGGDSLEEIYKKLSPEKALAAIGTFENPGVALQYCHDATLKMLAEEALNPDAPRTHHKGRPDTVPYLEAQVFGDILIARDVAKIVVDEDDLDAWEQGTLMDYNGPLPAKTKVEAKKLINAYAKQHGIDVQYIRTGSSDPKKTAPGSARGPGDHLAARRQGWEERSEAALKALRAQNWASGLKLLASVRPMGKGSLFGPSYATSGLTILAKRMTSLQTLAGQGQKQKMNGEQLATLAAETLEDFLSSAFNPDHLDEVHRVLSNCLVALRTCIETHLTSEERGQDHQRPHHAKLTAEQTLELQEMLRKKHPVSPEPSLPELESSPLTAVKSQPSDKEKSGSGGVQDGINHAYLYEDVDMYQLLNLMVARAGLADTFVVPPCDNIMGQQLQLRLAEELDLHRGQARKVLVPYNLGNYHWVGIYIDITANEESVRVWYMDPLRGERPAPVSVVAEVQQVYARASFQVAVRQMQSDSTSCGPITLRNLMLRAQGAMPEQSELMDANAIHTLRQQHVALMTLQLPDANFAHRQEHNLSTIRSVFNVDQYLKEHGNATFSPREYVRIASLLHDISQLTDDVRLRIQAAFASINSNPDMENAFYYRTLRKAIHNAYTEVIRSQHAGDLALLDRILQNLWGLRLDEAGRYQDFDDPTRFQFRDFEEIRAVGMRTQSKTDWKQLLESLTEAAAAQEATLKKAIPPLKQ